MVVPPLPGLGLPLGGFPIATPVTSTEYELESSAEAQALFMGRGWTDGLPIVPPTRERVAAFVAATGLASDHVVATLAEQAVDLVLEKVAVNAVMAGCLPEYAGVVLTVVQAMSEEPFNLHTTTVSGATAPLVIVSGPVVSSLGFNSSFSVFGPGHRANATIGRAIRLILQNLCGGVPGITDKTTMGHSGKYTYCIAESQDRNPWGPVHQDRGVPAEDSAVTVFSGEAPIFARNDWSSDPASILATIADAMLVGHFTGGCYAVVLGPQHAAAIARRGWTKDDVRGFLAQRARRSLADLKRAGRMPGDLEAGDDGVYRAVLEQPDHLLIAVAGGHLYGYSAVIPPWVGGPESMPVTRRIAATMVTTA